ncbi:hypothetical protein F444_18505, partial [Phytophthora nicotianae P1976]
EEETLQRHLLTSQTVDKVDGDIVTRQSQKRHKRVHSSDLLQRRVLDTDDGQNTGREEVLSVVDDVEEEPRAGRTEKAHPVVTNDERKPSLLCSTHLSDSSRTLLHGSKRLRLLRSDTVVADHSSGDATDSEEQTPHGLKPRITVLTGFAIG